ncbi:quinone oxidoreductase family protein [Gryllotalpicola protaetiae]|uniref:Zinc-binding alcohol dehydrogenase family protein n=1 Tax=Gryllotalpicola protaetiae TaxID=2419771 RepID=A0A387BUQ0_9MICO|nr:zinc-binding alcohol dehydrogenase family protein [Gryllotalpicola protaetiae]AYG04796.1 zinc-binding alcohol dehydrogenase family protein [Gryllotalpicola protaetiae]
MKAAVVTDFTQPPRFADFPEPVARDEDELVVEVLAAGLHPRVRSQASGSHYTSTDALPMVPGVDGVGRDTEGRLRYFVLDDPVLGAMAERTVIDARRSVVLPDEADPVAIAAAMNPVMSSWLALKQRAAFQAGCSVLILGATGSAGRMAVQVANHFGAARIVVAGRDPERLALAAAGAQASVSLLGSDEEIAAAIAREAAEVDVVLDYVWGPLTTLAMTALVTARPDRDKPLTWVEIGSVGGQAAAIPSAALRQAKLALVGSGQGSVGVREILGELPAMAAAIASAVFTVDAVPVPLAEVERAFADPALAEARVVIVP